MPPLQDTLEPITSGRAGEIVAGDAPECLQWAPNPEYANMAKAQKRSTREIRKPKADKGKAAAPVGLVDSSPVNALMRKPKAKL